VAEEVVVMVGVGAAAAAGAAVVADEKQRSYVTLVMSSDSRGITIA
jgi:hypothetical protein